MGSERPLSLADDARRFRRWLEFRLVTNGALTQKTPCPLRQQCAKARLCLDPCVLLPKAWSTT
jgi:hypothetical protein